MSSKKNINLPSSRKTMTLDELSEVMSMGAVVKAMKTVDLTYEPTDKEKLEEVMTHPELLARAVGLIVNNKTDKEIARVLDLTPVAVGYIRNNEFVKELCRQCFNESIDRIKNGLSNISDSAIASLAMLVDTNNKVSEKVRYMASMGILNTMLKLSGDLQDGPKKVEQKVNITQINNIKPEAQEAYERIMRDMGSIIPVAQTIYENTPPEILEAED